MNEKELIENRNDLQTEMELIIKKSKLENRAMSKEEISKFDDLKNKIENIDSTIERKEVLDKMDNKEIKDDNKTKMTKEQEEIKIFANYIRTNVINTATATQMTKGDNGAIIPSSIAKEIIKKVEEISPLFAMASKYKGKGSIIIPQEDQTTDKITVGYQSDFTELVSHAAKCGSVELKGELIGALSLIGKSLTNNSDFDLVNEVISSMAEAFSVFYEKEMLYGTTDKIKGIIGTYDTTNMKITLANKSSISAGELIDIQESIIDRYQKNCSWIMSRKTRKAIRKLKDGDGSYLLNKIFNEAWNYELLGRPVYVTENAKDMGKADDAVIFYGDFSGLSIKNTEELEINVLLEKFATQHAIGVCGYTELDAKVKNQQKIAVAVCGSTDPV